MRFSYFWTRTSKLIFVTLFAVHLAGCVFLWLAVHHKDEANTWIGKQAYIYEEPSIWTDYTYSMYWSVTTFTSVGYGDICPVTIRERIFTMLYMLFNMALTAYVIGNMTILILESATNTFAMRNSINRILEYGSKNRLPEGLKEQMLANMQLNFMTKELKQEHVIEHLPKAIKSSIAQHLFLGTVATTYLFKGVSDDFVAQLVSEVKAEYYSPKVEVILQNEMPTDFYIIVSGAVDVITYKNGIEQILLKLKSADIVGEIGVVFNIPQPFTIKTKRLSQVVRISHPHFRQIVRHHNEDGKKIMSNLIQYLKDMNQDMKEEMPFLTMLQEDKNIEHTTSSEEPQHCVRPNYNEGINTKGTLETITSSLPKRFLTRVIIHDHHPNENNKDGNIRGKLILLPHSIEDLFRISEKKFGKRGSAIHLADGLQVEELDVIRENDHLFIS